MTSQALSLYLDLEEGQVADIEVVARAALAFSTAIKDLAYVLDPSLEIRVELASGTAGSLSLNSIITSIKKTAGERPILAAIIVTAIGWFGNYGFTEGMDALRDKDKLSAEEIDEIAAKVALAMERKVAQPHVRKVYQELERDKAIKGVGATTVAGKRPADIVPRSDFPMRADPAILTDIITETHRTRTSRETVIIVRPVLLPGTRRWRFNSATGEFSASIKDDEFLEGLLDGRILLPMTGGVELDILLQVKEDYIDRVWVPDEYTVLRVYDRRYPPPQQGLFTRGEEKGD